MSISDDYVPLSFVDTNTLAYALAPEDPVRSLARRRWSRRCWLREPFWILQELYGATHNKTVLK